MLGAPAWHVDPVFENGGMVQPTETSTGSALTSSFKELGFHTDMQYPATLWPNMESACTSSSLFAGSFQGATSMEQMHHVSPTTVSSTAGAQRNLDFMDDFLIYSQLTPEGATPFANIYRVDNALAQSASGMTDRKSVPAFSPHAAPAHAEIPDCDDRFAQLRSSPVSTCTGLLNSLTLLSGSSGSTDQHPGGSSISMEQWNASTAFGSDNPPASETHGAPICGLGQPFDPSVQELGRLASRDEHRVLVKNAMPPSRLLPVTSVESTQQITSLPPVSSSWGQSMLEMSNPCLTQIGLVDFLSSEVNPKEVFDRREAYFGAQHMQMTSIQHTMSMTGLTGETRQDPVAAQACLNSSEFKYSGHTGEVSNSMNVKTVQLGDNLPSRFDVERPKSQFGHVSEANTVATPAGMEGTLQPHRVRPFSSGVFTIDGPPVWLPHTEQQENVVQSVPGRSLKASGNSFRHGALPMDLIPSQATGMAYRSACPSKPSGNVLLRQRKLLKLAPLVKPQGDQFGEMQMSHLPAGAQKFLRRKSPLQWSPKDALKAEDHVVRERRRRDVMNTRFQTLESLLPKPICRRDRYGIVEDAMVYVKEMERVLTHLKMKAASTKQRLEQQMARRQRQLHHIQEQPPSTSESRMRVANAGLPIDIGQANGIPRATWSGNMIQDSGTMPQDSKVEVLVPSNQQHVAIVVECRSDCSGRLFSGVLRVIEKLKLEVTQFSVTKCEELFLCNAACKPQASIGISHEQILQQLVTLLRSYLMDKTLGDTRH